MSEYRDNRIFKGKKILFLGAHTLTIHLWEAKGCIFFKFYCTEAICM